jgi:hypothetical protein
MRSVYRLTTSEALLSHFFGRNSFVRDSDMPEDGLWLHARVRSGEYFTTVATELDQVIQALASGVGPSATLPELERLVTELIEVSRSYILVPKS